MSIIYTTDVQELVNMTEAHKDDRVGIELVKAVAGMRTGAIVWDPTRNSSKGGFKGGSAWASKTAITPVAVCKAATCVRDFFPEVLTCDESEVQGRIIMFVAEYGNITKAYRDRDERDGRVPGEKTPPSLATKVEELVRWAKRQGYTYGGVTDALVDAWA